MYKLVLIRHGQSEWNKENRFCGWVDADLSLEGIEEARKGAKSLKDAGFTFDLAFTSLLKRAQRTLGIVLDELNEKYNIRYNNIDYKLLPLERCIHEDIRNNNIDYLEWL